MSQESKRNPSRSNRKWRFVWLGFVFLLFAVAVWSVVAIRQAKQRQQFVVQAQVGRESPNTLSSFFGSIFGNDPQQPKKLSKWDYLWYKLLILILLVVFVICLAALMNLIGAMIQKLVESLFPFLFP